MSNFKCKDKKIRKIIEPIKKANYLKACDETSYYLDQDLRHKVDYAYSCLSPEEQNFFCNEYLSLVPKKWYQYDFSKATYYRMKNAVMDNFLHCYEL